MPDQTARDAVRECFCGAAWCRAHGCPTFTICNAKADAVLSALGIPPDTTTDEVRAGLAALRIAEEYGVSVWPTAHDARARGYHAYVAAPDHEAAGGASPAAAVNALAAKLEEPK